MTPIFPDISFAFQPIINISSGLIVSYEALVRGHDNSSAWQVFQQVNDSNKHHFDEMLRVKALALATRLEIDCGLNLNLLPKSLEISSTAITSTMAMAEISGLPIDRITLEITESEIIDNVVWFNDAINTHRGSGLNISIDDFGAGYAGLNLLADFQPDSIKIDMSLLRNIDSRGPRQAIVRGIIRTCLDLGIDIIAEGIETENEYLWCYDEGIELFQGYFFAKPGFEHLPHAFFPKYSH